MTFLAFVTLLPLYVANSNYFPFITGKGFAFKVLVEIAFLLWVIVVLRERGSKSSDSHDDSTPRVNAITISVTTFTVLALVADLAGLNPLRSIWSNFERMEGWILIVHLWMYFMTLAHIFGSKEHSRKNFHIFLMIVLGSATISAFHGLSQFFGWLPTHQGATRVDASLGNSAYMAVYMLMSAGISAYMVFAHAIKRGNMILLSVYVTATVLFSFVLFQTATRGTILGWIGALLLGCAVYALWGRKEGGQSNLSRSIAAGVIGLTLILGVLFYFNRNAEWIQKNNVLGRLATISLTETKGQARGYVWPMAVKGVFESPKTALLGLGQENFNYIFNSHYNPKMWSQEQWFDRAHSVFLDWLVAGGLLGFLSYLALYGLSLAYIVRSKFSIGEKSALIATFVGYGIHNIFVFDNQTSYVMFFTLLAFISAHHGGRIMWGHGKQSKDLSENSKIWRDYAIIPVLIIASLISLYFVNIRVIRANITLIDALQACGRDTTASYEAFTKALKIDSTTANQEIREQLISCAGPLIRLNTVPLDVKEKFYTLTKDEITRQITETPDDARAYIIGGTFFNRINDFPSALPLLTKAHALSPQKQSISLELVGYYIATGDVKSALSLAEETYNLAQDNHFSRIAYISTLILADQEKKARDMFEAQYPQDFLDQRILNVYVLKKNYPRVISSLKQLILKDPTNPQYYGSLAAMYMSNKQPYESVQTLKALVEKMPETKAQITELIKQIESGKNPFQ